MLGIITKIKNFSLQRRNVDRNLGVVQSERVTIRSAQEGDSESHQLKENLLGSGLRYSVMRRSASGARYLH